MKSRLIRPAAAGVAYAIVVFGVGFVLGTIRTFLVAPRTGLTLAVLIELPVILATSWWISRLCVAHIEVSRAVAARVVMGAVAFLVLMVSEVTLSKAIFGRPVVEYLAGLTTFAGAIGLAGQVAFAGIPLIEATLGRPPASDR